MEAEKLKKKLFMRVMKYSLVGVAIVFVVLVAAYGYFTSERFLKHTLLPRLGKISGSEYSAETVELSFWHSTLKMTGVRIGERDNPFISGDLSGSFSILKIISGEIKVDDLTLDNVKVVLRQNAKGEWQIPFGRSGEKKKETVKTESSPDPNKPFPVFLNITNSAIKRIDFLLETDDGSRIVISDAKFKLPIMRNDELCDFSLTGKLEVEAGDKMKVKAAQAELSGGIRLRPDFMMQRLDLQLKLRQFSGEVNKIQLGGNELQAALNSYWDKSGIKLEKLRIEEFRQQRKTTDINVNSVLAFKPFAVDASIDIDPVSESLASLGLSFFHGYNPGQINLRYHGKIHYSRGRVKSSGDFYCRRQGDALIDGVVYPLPKFKLNTVHDMEIDLKHNILKIADFKAGLIQDGRKVIDLNIAPASLGIKDVIKPLSSKLTVDKLDVGIFRMIFADYAKSLPARGELSTKLQLRGRTLKKLRVTGKVDLNEFEFKVAERSYDELKFSTVVGMNLIDFAKIRLDSFKTVFSRQGALLMKLNAGQSSFNLKNLTGQLKLQLSGIDSSNLKQFGLPPAIMTQVDNFAPFELKLNSTADINVRQKHVVLNRVLLDIRHQSASKINLSLDEKTSFYWDGRTRHNKQLKKIRLEIANMTPKRFNTLLKGSDVKFNKGWLNSNIVFSVSDSADILKLNGKIALYDLDFNIGERQTRNVQFEQFMDIELNNFRQLEIKHLTGKAQLFRRPLFSFEGTGRLQFPQGKGNMRVYFNIPNHQLVNSFAENELKKLNINGNIGVETGDMFKTAAVTGNVKLVELLTAKLNQPIAGESSFRLSKGPELLRIQKLLIEIFSKRKLLMNLGLTSASRTIDGQEWENITIKSSRIDLHSLNQITARPQKSSTPDETKSPAETEPYSFDLGSKNYLIKADLRGISYGSDLNGTLTATVMGMGKTIKITPLKLNMNDRVLEVKGRFNSLPAGIKYALTGNCTDMSLTPFFRSIISGKMRNSRAKLNKLDFDLHGDGIAGNRLWDGMQGNMNVIASDISLPNTIRDTTLGNIMFLPLDGIAQFQKFMPLNLLRSSFNPSYYTNMFKRVKEFNFDRGIINARAGQRLIYIDKARFTGPVIRKLGFDGLFGLGSDKRIKLNSSLELLYLSMNLGITGTTVSPKLEFVKLIPQAIGKNITKVLDPRNIPGIFKEVEDDFSLPDESKKSTGDKASESPRPRETENKKNQEVDLKKALKDLKDLF